DVAREGDYESQVKRRTSMIGSPGEAVEDATESACRPVFSDKAQHVVPGVLTVIGRAAVNDDGQIGGAGHLHLLLENSLLHVARRVVIKIIKADLAPGDYLGRFRQALEFVEVRLFGQFGFVRMDSDRCVNPVVLLCQLDGAVERVRPRAVAIADREQGTDTSLIRWSDDFGAIGVEALAIEMSVGVGVHQAGSGTST